MNDLSNITPDFIKAMINLQSEVTFIKTGQEGQTGNRKFSYANLEDIWTVLQPLLCENRLWLTQEVASIDNAEWLISSLYHESGGYKTTKVKMRYTGDDIKIFGGAITYYRRYAMLTMFNLVATDDIEKIGTIKKDKEPTIDDYQYQQLKEVFDILDKTRQYRVKDMLTNMNVKDCRSLPAKNFQGFYNILLSLKDEQSAEFSHEVQDV